jgi:hypothetical protein
MEAKMSTESANQNTATQTAGTSATSGSAEIVTPQTEALAAEEKLPLDATAEQQAPATTPSDPPNAETRVGHPATAVQVENAARPSEDGAVLPEGNRPAESESSAAGKTEPVAVDELPIVAGEDPAKFRRIFEGVVEEEKAKTQGQIFLAEQAAYSAWKIRRYRQASGWIWNRAIADSLLTRVSELDAATELAAIEKNGRSSPALKDEDIVQGFRQVWKRHWSHLSLAAASGDSKARAVIEKKLDDTSAVSMNVHVDFDRVLESELLVSRLIGAEIAAGERAWRQLRKDVRRRQRQRLRQPADTGTEIDCSGPAEMELAPQNSADVKAPNRGEAEG